jgi:hypothetical protein
MQVVTERVRIARLAPSSWLRRVALQLKLRGVFEGMWWVAIPCVFDQQPPLVVNLGVATIGNKFWFGTSSSESNGTRSSRRFIMVRRTAPATRCTFSVHNGCRLAHGATSADITEKHTEIPSRARNSGLQCVHGNSQGLCRLSQREAVQLAHL